MDGQNLNFGKELELTVEDLNFVNLVEKEIAKLTDEERKNGFRNYIQTIGTCGFAGSGGYQTLINTDKNNGYKVTIREYSSRGTISNPVREYDLIINKLGKIDLGCTRSNLFNGNTYIRHIINEIITH
ncbi:hypothetical protein [Flavobacterium okayamense]|uniref:Uncharacterized protein n=1 Tax=Flavobacterium okayamense TaxID=2830782 RepID=A0ABN6I0D8_9FLAO|nr:hypothetical protein [Flavobacterium okayamense]BCY29097.1 hypothetical protein KK2020170_19650 [Flavobacterium okayamense]